MILKKDMLLTVMFLSQGMYSTQPGIILSHLFNP